MLLQVLDNSITFSIPVKQYNWNIVKSGVKHHKPNSHFHWGKADDRN